MEISKKTVLIVDDNANNLKVLAALLKERDFDFRMAKSGALALSILEKIKPDLILLDIQMPDMDGFETCMRIKNKESLAKIPVIFLTANIDAESIKNAFSVGGVDYVTKPFNPDELLARMNTHIMLRTQADELELQNATKNKFFSIISHDLRNPIGTIVGFSDLLLEANDKGEKEKVQSYGNVIHKSAEFTLDLLQNLLEWARIQTGTISPEKTTFNLSELLMINVEGFTPVAASKNISFFTDYNNELEVYADKKMIATIIRNLISNAIKFTPDGGVIKIVSNKNNHIVETTIADTGIGIDEKHLPTLFEVKNNYASKGTNNEKGTGLGLILCKEFINLNNGTIKVESKFNSGSNFIFTLQSLN